MMPSEADIKQTEAAADAVQTLDESQQAQPQDAVEEPAGPVPLSDVMELDHLRRLGSDESRLQARLAEIKARAETYQRLAQRAGSSRQVYGRTRSGEVTMQVVARSCGSEEERLRREVSDAPCFVLMRALAAAENPAELCESVARAHGVSVEDLMGRYDIFCRDAIEEACRRSAPLQGEAACDAPTAAGEASGEAEQKTLSPSEAERLSREGRPLAEVLAEVVEQSRDPAAAKAVEARCERLQKAWREGRALPSGTDDDGARLEDCGSASDAAAPQEAKDREGPQEAAGEIKSEEPRHAAQSASEAAPCGRKDDRPQPSADGAFRLSELASWGARRLARDARKAAGGRRRLAPLRAMKLAALRLAAALRRLACRRSSIKGGALAALAGAAIATAGLQLLSQPQAGVRLVAVDLPRVREVLLEAAGGPQGSGGAPGQALAAAVMLSENYEALLSQALQRVAQSRRAAVLDAGSLLVAHEAALEDVTAQVRSEMLALARESAGRDARFASRDAAERFAEFSAREAASCGWLPNAVCAAAAGLGRLIGAAAQGAADAVSGALHCAASWIFGGSSLWPDSLSARLADLGRRMSAFLEAEGAAPSTAQKARPEGRDEAAGREEPRP